MNLINKAGAIIFSKKDPTLILLLYRAKQGDWAFPKGHVETGETFIDAATREVKEETGLSVQMIDHVLPATEFLYPNGDRVVVQMFLAQSKNDDEIKKEHPLDETLWMEYRDVIKKLSDHPIRDYKKWYRSIFADVEATVHALRG